MRAYDVPLALLLLSNWYPLAAAATARIVSPANGDVLGGSAVDVEVALGGRPLSAARLDLNGHDVTWRLRRSGGVDRALFAGVPGARTCSGGDQTASC